MIMGGSRELCGWENETNLILNRNCDKGKSREKYPSLEQFLFKVKPCNISVWDVDSKKPILSFLKGRGLDWISDDDTIFIKTVKHLESRSVLWAGGIIKALYMS
jgi:hypothetical protein